MFTHHVVTSLLMYVCYAYRYTNIGNVILCIMDVVDFLLPVRSSFPAEVIYLLIFDSWPKCLNIWATNQPVTLCLHCFLRPGLSRVMEFTSPYVGPFIVTYLL